MLKHILRALVPVLAAVYMGGAALAAPVTNSFATGAQAPSYPIVSELFGSGAFVSGTFVYDSAAPHTTTAGGLSIFGAFSTRGPVVPSFTNLGGSVAGMSFANPQGREPGTP